MRDVRGDLPVRAHGWTWGDQLADAVAATTDPGRQVRGEDLWVRDAVGPLQLDGGTVAALVAGSRGLPYRATLTVDPLQPEDAAIVLALLREDPALTVELLTRPDDGGATAELSTRAGALGVPLAPQHLELLRATCTCPDPVPVCKHVVALGCAASAFVAENPVAWLVLRGTPLQDPAEGTGPGSPPAGPAPGEEPLRDLAEDYFSGAEVPEAPTGLRPRPAPGERDPDLLRAALRPALTGPGRRRARVETDVDGAVAQLHTWYAQMTGQVGGTVGDSASEASELPAAGPPTG